MKLENEKAREILYSNGAYIDGKVAYLPVKMVKSAKDSSQQLYSISTQDGELYIHVEGHNANFGCNPDNPFTETFIQAE